MDANGVSSAPQYSPPNSRKKSRKKAMQKTVQDFAETTTLGAVAIIHRSTQWFHRSLWILLLLVLLGATLWNVAMVLTDYLTYPVTTSVVIERQSSVPFPTVTVCNLNPVQCTRLVSSYVRHPQELRTLMQLSRCKTTVSRVPLISFFLQNVEKDPAMWQWVQGCNQTLMSALKNSSEHWRLKISEPNLCNEAYLKDFSSHLAVGTNASDLSILFTHVDHLFTACKSTSLEDVMFPEFAEEDTKMPIDGSFTREFSAVFKNKTLSSVVFSELVSGFEEFVVDCRYIADDCTDIGEFVPEFYPAYGICYTFNVVAEEKDFEKARKTFRAGNWAGMSMELLFNQIDYVPTDVAAGAGGRIAITDPGTLPEPNDAGHYIQPNAETDFKVSLSTISRLKAPYTSSCWDTWEESALKPFFFVNATSPVIKPVVKYSEKECNFACELLAMIQKCNCSDPYYSQPIVYHGVVLNDAETPVCIDSDVQTECITDVLASRESDPSLGCTCNLPCSENLYQVTTSSSEWPSYVYYDTLFTKYRTIITELAGRTAKNDQEKRIILSREFARVNIYFETLKVETVSEEVKYDLSKTLSDLGGATGLYLGICAVTFLEVLELVLSFLYGASTGLSCLQRSQKVRVDLGYKH